MRASGHAVESIRAPLAIAGLSIAARTLRTWCASSQQVPARTVTDAAVEDTVGSWRSTPHPPQAHECWPLSASTAVARCSPRFAGATLLPGPGRGPGDAELGLTGVTRDKGPRPTFRTRGPRVQRTCTIVISPPPHPTGYGSLTSPMWRTHTSFTYVAFVMDCFSQRTVG